MIVQHQSKIKKNKQKNPPRLFLFEFPFSGKGRTQKLHLVKATLKMGLFRRPQVNECHYCCIAMKQIIILYLITFPQYKVPSDYPVTSNFSISKEAKQGNTRKKLSKRIRLHICFVSVMLKAPANAHKHEANGVLLRDVGCFEALHGCLCCLLVIDLLVKENGGTLDSVPTK